MTNDIVKQGNKFLVEVEGIPEFTIGMYDEIQSNVTDVSAIVHQTQSNEYEIMLGVYALADKTIDSTIDILKKVTSITVKFLDSNDNIIDTVVRDNLVYKTCQFRAGWGIDSPVVISAMYTKKVATQRTQLNG